MPLGWLGAGAAAGGLFGGLFGGGGNAPQAPQMPYGGQANSAFSSGLTGLGNYANAGGQYVNGITHNPYAGGYRGAAGAAASDYSNLAPWAMGASQSLYGAGNSALGAGYNILNTAFDPQNQLYARTANQVNQAQQSALANSGVGATPYGAGVAGQTASNFNIDWQNNQLSRELQGLQGFGTANNTAQSDYAAGGQQGQLGAQSRLMAGALPYETSNTINNNSLAALLQGQGLYQNQTGAADQYLGLASNNYGNQLGQWNAQNQQNQQGFAGLGSLLGWGAGQYGGGGGGGGLGSSIFGLLSGNGNTGFGTAGGMFG